MRKRHWDYCWQLGSLPYENLKEIYDMDSISEHLARFRSSYARLRNSEPVRDGTATVLRSQKNLRKAPNQPDEFISIEELMRPYSQQFRKFKQLETERLLIRRISYKDAVDLYNYSKDPEVAQYVLWHAHTTLKQSKEYIDFLLYKYSTGKPASLGIIHKENQRLIGTIGFMELKPDCASADIGYSLHKAYWNKGLMTEALLAMLHYGFIELGLNRIEAVHESENPSSGRVLQKAGFQHEGHIRQKFFNKGRFVDVEQYAILFNDYIKKLENENAHV